MESLLIIATRNNTLRQEAEKALAGFPLEIMWASDLTQLPRSLKAGATLFVVDSDLLITHAQKIVGKTAQTPVIVLGGGDEEIILSRIKRTYNITILPEQFDSELFLDALADKLKMKVPTGISIHFAEAVFDIIHSGDFDLAEKKIKDKIQNGEKCIKLAYLKYYLALRKVTTSVDMSSDEKCEKMKSIMVSAGKSLKTYGHYYPLYVLKARCALILGHNDQAMSILEKAYSSSVAKVSALVLTGINSLQQGRFRSARDKFKRSLEIDSFSRAAELGIYRCDNEEYGVSYRAVDDIEKRAIAAELNIRAIIAGRNGDSGLAVSCLRKAIEHYASDSELPQLYHNLGMHLKKIGEVLDAEACERKAAELGYSRKTG